MSADHMQITPGVMTQQSPSGAGVVAGGPQPRSHPHQQQSQPQQSSAQQSHADLAAMKLTRGTSCVLCQQRKVRCDKNKPCANCVKARVECRVIPPQPPRRRKKRLQEKDLIDRLKKYESLLSENGVKFESIQAELRASGQTAAGSLGPDPEEVEELENDFEGLKTSPSSTPSLDSKSRSQSQSEKKWMPFHKEFIASEELLRDSSDDEIDGGSTIHNAFDKMYEHQDGFPFIIAGRNSSVTHYHPSAIHIFQLWQVYINNVNPLLRITHIPTIQGVIIEASSKLDKLPKPVEALMFAIYLMAVNSMEEDQVRRQLDEQKKILIQKYHQALQQALVNAGFMRTNDLITLQAYLLYLIGVRQFMDPRQIFCLVGVAVRIGQRMGLHRDGAQFGLSPYETEQRRRLWWSLLAYDRRIGEMTGSTVTALSMGGDCRLPLNINDTDLHVNGKDAPAPHVGPTEMLFALSRLEFAISSSSDSQRDMPPTKGDQPGPPGPPGTPGSAQGPAKPPQPVPIPTVRIAGREDLSYTIEGFCEYIEKQYLRYCDPKIPLHFFTLTMTRQSLCKVRVIAFLVRLGQGNKHPLNDQERDKLFLEATQMIEYDNVVQSAESLRGYKWYTYLHFPFPAYMFLVTELRQRTLGPMVERAWDALTENHELRGHMNNLHSPMHLAFGRQFVKAWAARATAVAAAGGQAEAPVWIVRLKANAERRSRNKGPPMHPVAGTVSGRPGLFQPMGDDGGGGGGPAGMLASAPTSALFGGNKMKGRGSLGQGMGMVGDPIPGERVDSPNDSSIMMTPSVDGTAAGMTPISASGPSLGAAGQQEDFDMDWATIMDQYNMGAISGLGGLAGFGYVSGGGTGQQDGGGGGGGMFPGNT